jgi:hypothetical protein
MFQKSGRKVSVKMNYKEEGFGGSSTSIPLSEGKLLDYLKGSLNSRGELTITHITDDEIYLTTSRSIEYQEVESKVDEIGDLIRNYVKSKAIKMEAYAVFAKGELKGVFGQEVNSRLKKSNLISKGYSEKEIEIKPVQIESFKDLE